MKMSLSFPYVLEKHRDVLGKHNCILGKHVLILFQVKSLLKLDPWLDDGHPIPLIVD